MADAQTYLDVAVPCPLRRSFHYLPPTGVDPTTLVPGMRLRVSFGRQRVTGILLGQTRHSDVAPEKLRRVQRLLDRAPVIPAALMKLLCWCADYYHHPIGEVMAAAIPIQLRQGKTPHEREVLEITRAGNDADLASFKRAPAQSALLRLLRSVPDIPRGDLDVHGISAAVARTVVARGLARWAHKPIAARGHFDKDVAVASAGSFALTPDQVRAIDTIIKQGVKPSLLFGVTGSGKTEVYLQLIARELAAGRQALVLVPEIGLTPQTVRRFTERFSVPVATMHSAMTDRERLDAWQSAREGVCGIVIGTRSAVFTPLERAGIIVVDEEHDGSFKQQDGFRYSARDLAVMRANLEKVPVVLGSATPSLESWHNAQTGKYALTTLDSRPGGAVSAAYRVLDIRNQPLTEGLSKPLLDDIGKHLGDGNQVLVFLNRRGFSPILLCHVCGWMALCHRCDARLTVHRDHAALICHHCGSQSRIQRRCPSCESDQLVPVGAGTQRLELTLTNSFSTHPVIRIDRDSTRARNAMDEFVKTIARGDPAILVGTQMLAKGHHFPDVTLVAIVDLDSGFYSANYKASEQMGQLILQVGGRSGRAEKPGVVEIQTHLPDQPIFRRLIDEGYAAFAEGLLTERNAHQLPPFHFHGLIRADATNAALPSEFLTYVADNATNVPSVNVLGPIPASMERRAGRYRAQLLVTSPHRKSLGMQLEHCIAAAEAAPTVRKVRWSVDVDPIDLF